MIQRTLVLLKPDAVMRELIFVIPQRFVQAGLKVVGLKMLIADDELMRRHYFDLEDRLGSDIYNRTIRLMTSGPIVALALEGVEAITKVRTLVGITYPDRANPGTIRGDFAHHTKNWCDEHDRAVANLVHASGNPEEAQQELKVWFTTDELCAYRTPTEQFTF